MSVRPSRFTCASTDFPPTTHTPSVTMPCLSIQHCSSTRTLVPVRLSWLFLAHEYTPLTGMLAALCCCPGCCCCWGAGAVCWIQIKRLLVSTT